MTSVSGHFVQKLSSAATQWIDCSTWTTKVVSKHTEISSFISIALTHAAAFLRDVDRLPVLVSNNISKMQLSEQAQCIMRN